MRGYQREQGLRREGLQDRPQSIKRPSQVIHGDDKGPDLRMHGQVDENGL